MTGQRVWGWPPAGWPQAGKDRAAHIRRGKRVSRIKPDMAVLHRKKTQSEKKSMIKA
jgi:hypothetical protein